MVHVLQRCATFRGAGWLSSVVPVVDCGARDSSGNLGSQYADGQGGENIEVRVPFGAYHRCWGIAGAGWSTILGRRKPQPCCQPLGEEGREIMTTAQTPVQGALFDVETDHTDPLIGYRGATVCQIAGITYRQLDYWTRTNLVTASIASAAGSGSQRLYSFRDILLIKIIKSLLDVGISLQNVRKALTYLQDRGVEDLSGLTLMSDGTTVYECRSAEEIVDLLAGGQGVFGLAVPGLLAELTGSITAFPSQRADAPAPVDELAARRAAKVAS